MSAEPYRKAPYSPDLGWRVVWQRLGMDKSYREIAKCLQISNGTAHRIFKKFETTGEVSSVKLTEMHNFRMLDDHHELLILGLVADNPCLYLRELSQMIFTATNVRVSGSTICRALKKNGFTRKKAQQVARQRCIEYRAMFMARVLQYSSEMFVWIDETGSDARTNIRKFGYAIIGEAPIYHRFLTRGKRISAIAAICTEGVIDVELATGSINGEKFIDFVRGCVIPNMHPFDGTATKSIAILDNCSIHHVSEAKQAFEDAGILLLFLPPYSPDLNPIEQTFSCIKYYLRDHDDLLQCTNNPTAIIQAAFDAINAEQCCSWIKNSGYA